jgi:hypothetical protein
MPSRPPSSSGDKELHKAKDEVFEKLAPLDFVSGAGIQDGRVAVYLTRPLAPHEEKQVHDTLSSVKTPGPVEFVVTGAISPR